MCWRWREKRREVIGSLLGARRRCSIREGPATAQSPSQTIGEEPIWFSSKSSHPPTPNYGVLSLNWPHSIYVKAWKLPYKTPLKSVQCHCPPFPYIPLERASHTPQVIQFFLSMFFLLVADWWKASLLTKFIFFRELVRESQMLGQPIIPFGDLKKPFKQMKLDNLRKKLNKMEN